MTSDADGGISFRSVSFGCFEPLNFWGCEAEARCVSREGEERDNGVCAPARLFLLFPCSPKSPNPSTLFGKKDQQKAKKKAKRKPKKFKSCEKNIRINCETVLQDNSHTHTYNIHIHSHTHILNHIVTPITGLHPPTLAHDTRISELTFPLGVVVWGDTVIR